MDDEELLDDDDLVIDAEEGLGAVQTNTRAHRIARISSTMGFHPRQEHNAFVAEYSKAYALPGGNRAARATVQFDKGVGGIEHARLKGFVITVTAYLPAVPELVMDQAPSVMRDDLLNYIQELGGIGDIEPPVNLVVIECGGCQKQTPEFFRWRDKRLCRECFTTRVGAAPPQE